MALLEGRQNAKKERKEMAIKIVAIQGSIRPGNFTAKALALSMDELNRQQDVVCEWIDPTSMNLPLPGKTGGEKDAETLRARVREATGVILTTPEYHGSYSSVIKLVIENLGFPSVLSGKPVALLGVAAGRIGAIKALEHLRSVCSHIGAIVIPMPISIANVQTYFDDMGRCNDPEMEMQIRSVGINLLHYIQENLCPRVTLEALVRGKSV